MRDFDFLFNEEGNVREGLEVVVLPEDAWYYGPKIVKLAGFRPYWTDGSPDPSNDEVNEWCYIEVEGDIDDPQVRLSDLFEFKRLENVKKLYMGEEVEILGSYEDDNEDEYYAFMLREELKFEDSCLLEEKREIWDLNDEELEWFYKHCTHGSIYLSDYHNNLGIDIQEASGYAEMWIEDVESGEYKDTFEDYCEWASYLCA